MQSVASISRYAEELEEAKALLAELKTPQ